jgi:hypothetical protein
VYEEEFTFFIAKTLHPQGTSSHKVNYLLTSYADNHGALQVNRYIMFNPTSPTVGSLVCQLNGVKYQEHQYEDEVLNERYSAFYNAYKGGTVPPPSAIPDPSVANVRWEANCNGEYTLHVDWFLRSKAKSSTGLTSSYSYTLHCRPID